MRDVPSGRWPKALPPLTDEQRRISDDFMHYWHEVLPKRFGVFDRFSHRYPVRHAPAGFRRTLEIGSGLGEHLAYESLTDEQRRDYVGVDIRANMAEAAQKRFPGVRFVVADAAKPLPFPDGWFDRIVAVHVLEHLPDLPAVVEETYRLCDRARGVLSVVIPCEGSWAYSLARRISAQRIFERRYGQSYRWFIEREHLNLPHEVLEELGRRYRVVHRTFFPLPIVPAVRVNLGMGLTLRPRT